jgi:cytochrome b561
MIRSGTKKMNNHGILAKIFHWGFAVVLIYALLKQIGDVRELADTALLNFEIIFATAFLVLLAVRFCYMHFTMPTAVPDDTSRVMRFLARAGHLAMYVSLTMIALSGLIIGALFKVGGAEAIGMQFVVGFHEVTVLASYITIGLHVLAAFYHRLKCDGIWSSMVPIWKDTQK